MNCVEYFFFFLNKYVVYNEFMIVYVILHSTNT